MEDTKQHMEAIESYISGNVPDFKAYLDKLNKMQLLDLLTIFVGHGYSLLKLKYLLER